MRIISGAYRGLRLQTLKSGKVRPTSDQLRETLFDVLGPAVAGSTFLDAYAGSGAVGLEVFDGGYSGADAVVVGDRAVRVEGDIEVDAHENTFVVDIDVAHGLFHERPS